MDFGVNLLTRGITGGAEGLLAVAGKAEAPEKPASISKKELEEWAALFRSRKPDDEADG